MQKKVPELQNTMLELQDRGFKFDPDFETYREIIAMTLGSSITASAMSSQLDLGVAVLSAQV